jgi:DNA invertase Pin-like site-specific DNA recombinase
VGLDEESGLRITRRHKIIGHPNVAVAYLRASTDEQRLSPEAQRACIQAWAIREDARVAAWYADRVVCSVAPIADRPALRAALAALGRHRAGLLVVAKRDRIARDVVLAVEVERAAVSAGARLVSEAPTRFRGRVTRYAQWGLVHSSAEAAPCDRARRRPAP